MISQMRSQDWQQTNDYEWAKETYGTVVDGQRYQAMRFLEEALELVQSQGLTLSDIKTVSHYVYLRPVGEETVEIGDVQISLNILAETRFQSIATCREECLTKSEGRTIEEARAKDKMKMDAGLI